MSRPSLHVMFDRHKPNLGLTLLALTNILLPIFAAATAQFGKAISETTLIFGFMLLCASIIVSKKDPTVLGGIFTGLIGVTWFLTVMGVISTVLLAVLSIFLFAFVLVFELAFKIGPSNAKAKAFILIPLFCLAFTLVLAFPGLNTLMRVSVFWTTRLAQNPFTTTITLNYLIVLFSYVATILFCWLYIFDYAGWQVFKRKTYLWMNILAVAAIVLSFLAWIQGVGIVTW